MVILISMEIPCFVLVTQKAEGMHAKVILEVPWFAKMETKVPIIYFFDGRFLLRYKHSFLI